MKNDFQYDAAPMKIPDDACDLQLTLTKYPPLMSSGEHMPHPYM